MPLDYRPGLYGHTRPRCVWQAREDRLNREWAAIPTIRAKDGVYIGNGAAVTRVVTDVGFVAYPALLIAPSGESRLILSHR